MKKLKHILACVMIVMTASLVLVGCGKKDTDPDDYLAGVYYEEIADNLTVTEKEEYTMQGEKSTNTTTTKLKKDGDTLKVYLTSKSGDYEYKYYNEAINQGLYYEMRSYNTSEEAIAEHGKVYTTEEYTRFELEVTLREVTIGMIQKLYDEDISIPGANEVEVKDKKVDGSEKKFTYTANLVADEIDKGTVTLKVEKKRVVSFTVDVTLKKQEGQDKADYYKDTVECSYKKVDISFDTKGYVEELQNEDEYIRARFLPNENFTMTATEGTGEEAKVTTLQYSVAKNGTAKVLVKEKTGEAEAEVKLYVEYVKDEQGTYDESVYANGTGEATTTNQDIVADELVNTIMNTLAEKGYYTLAYLYVNYSTFNQEVSVNYTSLKQEGNKNTFTLNASMNDESHVLVVTIVDGKVTGGTLSKTASEQTTTTTTYTYTYKTAEVNYTPTVAD